MKPVMADTQTKVVIGDGKKSRRPHVTLTKRGKIIAVIVMVLLIVIAAVAFLVIQRREDIRAKQAADTETKASIGAIRSFGNVDEALTIAQNGLAKASTDEDRLFWQGEVAAAYNKKGQTDQAIDMYKKMYETNKENGYAELIADAYNEKGDKNKALEYYQKAIKDIPDSPSKGINTKIINTKISELGL